MNFKAEYFNIWMTVWNFHKKYTVMGKMDWEQAVDESVSIVEDYKGSPEQAFIKNLLIATLKELQRRDSHA